MNPAGDSSAAFAPESSVMRGAPQFDGSRPRTNTPAGPVTIPVVPNKDERIHMRVTPEQKLAIETDAEAEELSVSSFLLMLHRRYQKSMETRRRNNTHTRTLYIRPFEERIKSILSQNKTRCKQYKATDTLTEAEVRDIFYSAEGKCHYCKKHVGIDALVLDHVLSISKGGPNSKENCVAACRKCNSRKSWYPVENLPDFSADHTEPDPEPVSVSAGCGVGNPLKCSCLKCKKYRDSLYAQNKRSKPKP